MTVEYRDDTPFTGNNHTPTELANAIRTKKDGKDVREPIAQLAEKLSNAVLGRNIGNVVAAPTKVFGSLAELQKAYPNGADGVMVTVDDGHKHFWQNGTWVDGGVYQASGLTDKQISEFTGRKSNTISVAENATSEANSSFWIFHHKYEGGFVEKISIFNKSKQADATLAIYRFSDDKLVDIFHQSGAGKVDFEINKDFGFDFYIGIRFDGFLFDNETSEYKSSGSLTPDRASDLPWSIGGYQAKVDVTYKDMMSIVRGKVEEVDVTETHCIKVADNSIEAGNQNFWIFKKRFPAGFVNAVTIFNDGTEAKGIVAFFDSETDQYLFEVSGNGEGEVELNVSKFIPSFYIGIKFDKFLFDKTSGEGYKSSSILSFLNSEKFEWKNDIAYQAKINIIYNSFANEVVKNFLNQKNQTFLHNRMIVVGDSIVAGYPSNSNWTTALEPLGWDVERGAKTGAGWQYIAGNRNARWMADNTDWSKYDVAVIAFGTNDYGNNIPIGTENDTQGTVSLVGAIKYTLSKIESVNPNLKIICLGPINRTDHGSSATDYAKNQANDTGKTLSDYNSAIKREVEKLGISFIDNLMYAPPFSQNTMAVKLIDRLHPTSFGYKLLGASNAAKINSIIKPF